MSYNLLVILSASMREEGVIVLRLECIDAQ